MCRLTAYVGRPVSLADVVLSPPHSLLHQSYAPQYQTRGRVNADGFGVGWYAPDIRPEPARYRSATPIWADASFASLAPVVTTNALLASVRSATPPNPVEPSGVAPYTSGPWLFAHNGSIEEFRSGPDGREGVRSAMTALVSAGRLAGVDGASDSELLFALVLDHLDQGATPASALRDVISQTRAVAPACLNMVLTDGTELWATVSGESLFARSVGDSTTLASEPLDEDPAWDKLPEDSVVRARPGRIEVSPL